MTKLQTKLKELRVTPKLLSKTIGIERRRYYETYQRMNKTEHVLAICEAIQAITGEYVAVDDIIERGDK